jgi:hypothetical protein
MIEEIAHPPRRFAFPARHRHFYPFDAKQCDRVKPNPRASYRRFPKPQTFCRNIFNKIVRTDQRTLMGGLVVFDASRTRSVASDG